MKLKRIFALAAAGVLAVSMLTGCFGSGNGNTVDVVSDFVTTLNGATNGSPEVKSNSRLTNAVRRVATTLTATQAGKEGLADQEILDRVRDITNTAKKPELDQPTAWTPWNSNAQFTTVRIYDADNVTVANLANDVKDDIFDVIQLGNATTGAGYTNSYDVYASAVEVTIPGEGDAVDVNVYVVGIQIDRTATAE